MRLRPGWRKQALAQESDGHPSDRPGIILFQHYRFTIENRNSYRAQKRTTDSQRLVQVRADELDIPTRLVWDEAPTGIANDVDRASCGISTRTNVRYDERQDPARCIHPYPTSDME